MTVRVEIRVVQALARERLAQTPTGTFKMCLLRCAPTGRSYLGGGVFSASDPALAFAG